MLATIYVLFVFAATLIPYLGTFLILLLSPAMAAGVLTTVRDQLAPNGSHSMLYLLRRARSVKAKLLVVVGRPAHALFNAFADEDRMLPLMGIGFATAFLGVLVQVLALNIGGAFYMTTDGLQNIGILQWLRLLTAYGILLALSLALVVVYIYFLSLFVIDRKPIGTAFIASFQAFMRNAIPCLAYSATLVLPLLLAGQVADVLPVTGLFTLLIVGSIALPLLINSAYCTARLMYRV